jgi:mannitol 2-dehydrogenase
MPGNPDASATAFGAIAAGLTARRAAELAPFIVMSCHNLPGNGNATRAAVAGLARLSDPVLADWIEAEVAFPNGRVDRITPATGPRERAMVTSFGLADDLVPVTCEPFRQRVLEDRLPKGRPPLEELGVTVTDHVHAHEAMAYPLILGFLDKVEGEEIIPYLPPVPGADLAA